MIQGVTVVADGEAVVVVAEGPLDIVSSAPVRGGVVRARSLVNLHVTADFAARDLETPVDRFARSRALPPPWVGFLTAAKTEQAEIALARVDDVVAMAVVTVGLSHPIAAGIETRAVEIARMRWAHDHPLVGRAHDSSPVGTINAVVIVDAAIDTAALVNAIAAVAEVKASVLAGADVRCRNGALATGTATDAIAVAATGRGPCHRFAGAASAPGGALARATRSAIERGVTRWIEAHR